MCVVGLNFLRRAGASGGGRRGAWSMMRKLDMKIIPRGMKGDGSP